MTAALKSQPLPESGPVLVSEEEFLALPESMDRVELIDGEVIVPPSPTRLHQRILLKLARRIADWADERPPAVIEIAPLDIRVGPGRILQPDAMVWLEGLEEQKTPIHRVPDLVIEVLSDRRVYDRITKRALYADASIREYWVVDPTGRQVEVFTGASLTERRLVKEDLSSSLLPGFSLTMQALFGES